MQAQALPHALPNLPMVGVEAVQQAMWPRANIAYAHSSHAVSLFEEVQEEMAGLQGHQMFWGYGAKVPGSLLKHRGLQWLHAPLRRKGRPGLPQEMWRIRVWWVRKEKVRKSFRLLDSARLSRRQ